MLSETSSSTYLSLVPSNTPRSEVDVAGWLARDSGARESPTPAKAEATIPFRERCRREVHGATLAIMTEFSAFRQIRFRLG